MANYVSNMPLWAIVLFAISFIWSVDFIAKPAKLAALNAGMAPRKAGNIRAGILVFYILYLGYVSVLSLQGTFAVNSLPPKAMVWGGLPLLILLFGVAGNTGLFKKLLRAITLESLVRIHLFRLVGAFFILLYCYRLLPVDFALSAGLGDIVTALLAFPVAKMLAEKHPRWVIAVYAWNILGILDIATLLVLAVAYTIHPVTIGVPGNLDEMTKFPFVWFPAFAPATIWFLHVAIFRKLREHKYFAVAT